MWGHEARKKAKELLEEAKAKVEKLIEGKNYEIIKRCFGGIVVNTDRNYRGRWVYFDKPIKDFNNNSFDDWIDLML